jgi:hypothetical protein
VALIEIENEIVVCHGVLALLVLLLSMGSGRAEKTGDEGLTLSRCVHAHDARQICFLGQRIDETSYSFHFFIHFSKQAFCFTILI